MSVLFVGATVLLTNTFSDTAGVATQMTTISLDILRPDGVTVSVASGDIDYNSTTKEYSSQYIPTQAGIYDYRWTGTDSGGSVAIQEGEFFVRGVFA